MYDHIDDPQELHDLAHNEADNGHYDFAIELITRAIDYYPDSTELYFCRANFKLEQQNFEGALGDYKYYLIYGEGEKDALVHHNMGVVYANLTILEESYDHFTKALELSPDFIAAYHSRAHVSILMQNYREAIDDLTAALDLEDDNSHLYMCRGKTKLDYKDHIGALLDFEMVKRLKNIPTLPLYTQAEKYIQTIKSKLSL